MQSSFSQLYTYLGVLCPILLPSSIDPDLRIVFASRIMEKGSFPLPLDSGGLSNNYCTCDGIILCPSTEFVVRLSNLGAIEGAQLVSLKGCCGPKRGRANKTNGWVVVTDPRPSILDSVVPIPTQRKQKLRNLIAFYSFSYTVCCRRQGLLI